MIRILLKYFNHIVTFLFLIGLALEVVVKEQLNKDLYIKIIDYYFWFSFGVFTGVFLTGIANRKLAKRVNRASKEIPK